MTIRGERAISRCIRVPPAAQRFTAGSALDSSRVMTELASNTAHLCEESVRHLVSDPGFNVTVLSAAGLLFADSSQDGKSANSLAPHTWQRIRFTRQTGRRFGPFALVADEGTPTQRRGRAVRVRCDLVVPPDAVPSIFAPPMPAPLACAVLTAGPSIAEVVDGRGLAYHEWSGLVAGRNELDVTLVPGRAINKGYPEHQRMRSSGTQLTQVNCFYLWFGVSLFAPFGELSGGPGEVLSLDAWETRTTL